MSIDFYKIESKSFFISETINKNNSKIDNEMKIMDLNKDLNSLDYKKYMYDLYKIQEFKTEAIVNEYMKEIMIKNQIDGTFICYLLVSSQNNTISMIDILNFKLIYQIYTMSDYCKILCLIDYKNSMLNNFDDESIYNKVKNNEFLIATGFSKFDKSIKLYKLQHSIKDYLTNENVIGDVLPIGVLSWHKKSVYSLDYLMKYDILISGSFDHTVALWKLENKLIIKVIDLNKIYFSAFPTFISKSYIEEDLVYLGLNKKNGIAFLSISLVYDDKSDNIMLETNFQFNNDKNYKEVNDTVWSVVEEANNNQYFAYNCNNAFKEEYNEYNEINFIYFGKGEIVKIMKITKNYKETNNIVFQNNIDDNYDEMSKFNNVCEKDVIKFNIKKCKNYKKLIRFDDKIKDIYKISFLKSLNLNLLFKELDNYCCFGKLNNQVDNSSFSKDLNNINGINFGVSFNGKGILMLSDDSKLVIFERY